ncbi:porin family protein [Urechidicola croceus]|uniref:TonB-dependent receptor n=1 Tax=Urechidicola croceus TaxID=1850246 RepID=A0A1D8PAX7_9FLAO|nr:hypothetical protein [Urechidicola croceus]AOW21734.1 hypothetical protein LPB138_14060 [Urechidicola croceus]
MKKLILIFVSLITTSIVFAQTERVKDTLNTDEIIVVKPYTPTISDAFKIKENPTLENEKIAKDSIQYTIYSVPVASTFTPAKGKAQSVVREPLDKIYDNYIAAGFGNYTTPYLEAHLHSSSSRTNDFGAFVKHHSSKGGIKDVLLDDNFSDTRLDLYYKEFERDYNWELNAGVHHQIYNWYGLPQEATFDPEFLNSVEEKQKYLNIFAGGKVQFEDGILKGGTVELNQFSDDYNSSEIHLLAKPKIEFPISSELINTTAIVEFITGKFDQNYITDDNLKYTFLKLGVNPNFEVLRNDLTVNLGATVYYSFDLENKANKLFAYPNVTASYQVMEETLTAYAGVTGDLHQNSHREFAKENPFVSPTLNIQQTDQQYNAFIGTKGKLSSNVSYNFKVSYQNENNKPLYLQNFTKTDGIIPTTYGYEAGNSFRVVYDNVETFKINADINVDVSREFELGSTIEFSDYSTTNQVEAWNLPTIKATIFADYQTKKWYGGANLYFIGSRNEFIVPFEGVGESIELDSYVDLNLNGGYIFTDRLTAFGRVNNVLSTNYERFANYDVQGIQVLAGIIYKFDF